MANRHNLRLVLLASKRGNPFNSMKYRLAVFTVIGATILGSTGCNLLTSSVKVSTKEIHSWVDESMSNYRDRTLAEKAWIQQRSQHRKHEYTSELKRGFVAGYLAVANGGNGCTPPIAPQEYWGWKYQSPFGQAAVHAWFEGYPLGAKAADQDGVGNWSRVQLNLRESQQFQPDAEALSEQESSVPTPTVLERAKTESAVIPSPSDMPREPEAGGNSIGPAAINSSSGTNASNTFVNQASNTSAATPSSNTPGLGFPGATVAGAVSMTGPESGDGVAESPSNYDDWLRNMQGEPTESETPSDAIEFQFDSETDELPFTIE